MQHFEIFHQSVILKEKAGGRISDTSKTSIIKNIQITDNKFKKEITL